MVKRSHRGMTKDQVQTRYLVMLKRYRDMFGYVPNPDDYVHLSLDQFYETLIKCINSGKEVNKFLIYKKNFITKKNA